jgi:hypothetical protein
LKKFGCDAMLGGLMRNPAASSIDMTVSMFVDGFGYNFCDGNCIY